MTRKCFQINTLCDSGLLHDIMREDHKLFHELVVPIAFIKYILHQGHDALGHNGTAKT